MEKETKYSLFGNIRYAYHTLFHKCAWMRLGVIGIILTHLGGTILQTVTMPVIVASITQKGTPKHFMFAVIGLLAAYLLLYYLGVFVEQWCFFYYENTQKREF